MESSRRTTFGLRRTQQDDKTNYSIQENALALAKRERLPSRVCARTTEQLPGLRSPGSRQRAKWNSAIELEAKERELKGLATLNGRVSIANAGIRTRLSRLVHHACLSFPFLPSPEETFAISALNGQPISRVK